MSMKIPGRAGRRPLVAALALTGAPRILWAAPQPAGVDAAGGAARPVLCGAEAQAAACAGANGATSAEEGAGANGATSAEEGAGASGATSAEQGAGASGPRSTEDGAGASGPRSAVTGAAGPTSAENGTGAGSDREDAEAARLEEEAEAAIREGDLARAQAVLQESLARPENLHTPRARELMGVVLERTGRAAEARRVYSAYLARYPSGDDAERVRQRLAALDATPVVKLKDDESDGSAWHTDVRAALSEFYLRDRSRSDFDDAARPETGTATDRRVNVDELLSTADVTVSAIGPATRIDARASAAYVAEYRPVTLVGADRQQGSYPMYYEHSLGVANETLGLSARVGRQTRFGDGIFGRFDGTLLGWRVTPRFKLNAFTGHPVWSPRQTDVDGSHTFRGGSIEHASASGDWWVRLHWLEQSADGLEDRRSVGTELRLQRNALSVDALVDYDVFFDTLNAAYVDVDYGLGDGSMLAVRAQLLHYPSLALSNSILGQPVPTVESVRESFDAATLERLALERTIDSQNLDVTYSRPVGSRLQVIGDAGVSSTGDSPASAGVAAYPGPGTEYYAGGRLVAAGLLEPRDTWLFSVRYASLRFAQVYSLEATARLPLTRNLSIAPRLRFTDTYQSADSGGSSVLQPTIRLLYDFNHHAEIDASIGENLIRQTFDGPAVFGRRREKAFIAYAGFRVLF